MASSRASAARAAVDLTFEELYRGHHADVYRAALRELGNAHDAEDVTQAAFVDAYKAVLRGTQPQSPRAWLLAISENVRKRRYRTSQRRPRELPLDADFPLAADLPTEQAHALAEALAALPPEQRRVFVFREIVGLSYEEIATRVDSTVASVQMLLFRARRSLREVLDPPVVSRRKAGAWVPIPGWLTGLVSRLEPAGLTPRVVGATGATALAVLGSSVAVPQAPADVRPPSRAAEPTQQPASAPAKVVARVAAKRASARSTSPKLRPTVRVQTTKASKPKPTATAAAAPGRPPALTPVATASPEITAAPGTAAVVPTTSAVVPTTAVAVPLPVPGVLPPELTVPVPDVQLPVEPQKVVPKLPVPVPVPPLPSPAQVVEVAAGAAGAAGASAPPLPVPSVPLVALPQAP